MNGAAFALGASFVRQAMLWMTLVFACTLFIANKQVRSKTYWEPDGFLYGRMMLSDLGVPEDQARDIAAQFYLTTQQGKAENLPLYSRTPPRFFQRQFALFSGRLLYPYIASKLYRFLGFRALTYTSAVAYLLSSLALFWLLLYFGPPWLAAVIAVGTTAVLREPLVATVGTDALAYLLFLCTLAAMTGYMRTRRVAMPLILGTACILLALTRPAVYLPLGAALGVTVLALKTKNADELRIGRTLTAITASSAMFYVLISLALHGPGLLGQLQWLYEWQREVHARLTDHGFWLWYPFAIGNAAIHAISQSLYSGTPILAALIAVLGLSHGRNDPAVFILYGASVASVSAIVVDPMPWDLSRTIGVPLAPVLAVGIVMAARLLLPGTGAATSPRILPRRELDTVLGSPPYDGTGISVRPEAS